MLESLPLNTSLSKANQHEPESQRPNSENTHAEIAFV
jgi:hypothetical protein